MPRQLLCPIFANPGKLRAALLHPLLKRLEEGGLAAKVLRMVRACEREQIGERTFLAVAGDMMDITQQIFVAFLIMLHMSQKVAGCLRCRCAGRHVCNGTSILVGP